MSAADLFDRLFGAGAHQVRVDGDFVHGPAHSAGRDLAVIGTWNAAAVDGDLALAVAGAVLDVVAADADKTTTPRPIVFIADTSGQQLARHEELLGLNGAFAHLAHCVDLARRHGHPLLTLVHGEAVSGGFLAFGLLADRVCALADAEVRVMDLRAMARVTRIQFERLQALAQTSPVFAPGAENYWRMGAVDELWRDDEEWTQRMAAALGATAARSPDQRSVRGAEREGRQLAAPISALVANA